MGSGLWTNSSPKLTLVQRRQFPSLNGPPHHEHLENQDILKNYRIRRYVVPTGRVKVPAGRYVVPTGKDNVIVSTGRTKVIPAGSTILVLVVLSELIV
ncbi:hypothetical protein Tco_1075434 [Tanacetum coccineum]